MSFYQVLNNNPDAFIYFAIKCPYTRADWKLEILFENNVSSKAVRHGLNLGKFAVGEVVDNDNIFSYIAIELINIDAEKMYKYNSSTFSVNKDDNIIGSINKNRDDSAGFINIIGINLVY